MKLADFATRLGWDDAEVLPRLRELDLTRLCSRCAGTGHYTLDDTESRCWKCRGKGDELPMLTRELASEVAVLVVQGGLDRYIARQARQRAAAREIPRLLTECSVLYERTVERQPVRAAAIYFGSDYGLSVRELECMVEKSEIDPESAAVVLGDLLRRLSKVLADDSLNALSVP